MTSPEDFTIRAPGGEFPPSAELFVAPEVSKLLAPDQIGEVISKRDKIVAMWCAWNGIENRDDLTIRDKAEIRTMPGWQEIFHQAQLESLPYNLGFIETSELKQLKHSLTESADDQQEATVLTLRYILEAEQLVDTQSDKGFVREQLLIGFYIATGLVRRATGNEQGYINDLEAALAYADFRHYDDVAEIIAVALVGS